MPIIEIAPVTRKGMKLLMSFFGLSETGKTLSALKVMAGVQPDPRKRGLLDTEGGERGRAYMDAIEGGYMYGALTAPFTPERYMEALHDFVAAGVTDLCVDSVSHAWFAAGGILDMVENATEKNDMAKWAKPKRRLGKLTGQWLGCGLNLYLCSRGKQPLIEVDDERRPGKQKLINGPVVPIQEKSLRFDMTIMALMLGDGEFTIERQWGGKCPGALRPIFAAGTKMDEDMGRKLAAWLGGQDATTTEQRGLALDAREAANRGVIAYQTFWKGLTKGQREGLLPQHENLKSIAQSADDETARVAAEQGAQDTETNLDTPFGGAAIPGGVHLVGDTATEAEAA